MEGDNPETASWDENRVRGGLFCHDLTPKKSALMLKKLMTEIWHTEEDLITDESGYVEFRGFYGEYEAIVEERTIQFGIHKCMNNYTQIEY